VALIVVLGLATLWAIVRSLFVRGSDEDPGLRLELDREPQLRAVLDDVAARIGTEPVHSVYMTPGTEVAVTERGGMWRRVRGRTERCLILGVGVLDGMKLRELEAILGHEYGHLRNADTAGGGLALAVRRSMFIMMRSIAQSGAATWYNPAWWFLNGYVRVFLRISLGASRLQEILADRWAAIAYGSAAFARGLTHVIARRVRFSAHANDALREVVAAKRPLANLYRYELEKPPEADAAKDVESKIREALEREPDAYDSHPAPKQRLALVQALAAPGTADVDEGAEAWSLFADRERLEKLMTDEVRRNVHEARGVEIAAEA
jgi:Zn-dependent protease with chaperone function